MDYSKALGQPCGKIGHWQHRRNLQLEKLRTTPLLERRLYLPPSLTKISSAISSVRLRGKVKREQESKQKNVI